MALTETRPATEAPVAPAPPAPAPSRTAPSAAEKLLGTGDHKVLGRLLIGTSLVLLAVELAATALVNFDTGNSKTPPGFLTTDAHLRLTSNSMLGLLICGVLPLLLGVAYYVVPLQVGSPSISFPRAAAAAFWSWLLSSVIFLVAMAADGAYNGTNLKMARMGNVAAGAVLVSIVLGAICVAVTVLSARAPGLSLRRVPAFSFSMLVAATLWTLTLPSALARIALLQIEHANASTIGTAFGDLGWLFRQPTLYIAAIPVLGIVADAVPVMARTPQRYGWLVQLDIGLLGFAAFGAFSQTGEARNTFIVSGLALFAALPVLGILATVGVTLREGRPSAGSPLIFSVAALLGLLATVLAGSFAAINTAGHGSLRVLADDLGAGFSTGQYYLVIGTAITAGVGALYYWGEKIWGGQMSEIAGRGSAVIALLGTVLMGGGHVVLGIVNPSDARPYAIVAAIGAALLGLAVLGALAAIVGAVGYSGEGNPDPWSGHTLEWATSSPPPAHNFDELPVIESATPVLDAREKGAS